MNRPAAPHYVELRTDNPGDLFALVHYIDADTVTVRRRGPEDAPRWTCGKHGDDTDCRHALAVDLTLMARDALTDPQETP